MSELLAARAVLEQAAALVPDEQWGERPCDGYSPIGWHLGHVAAVQARFLLGEPPDELFDAEQTQRPRRKALSPSELRARLAQVLQRSLAVLDRVDEFLVHHVAQHELQHAEHAQVIAALLQNRLHLAPPPAPAPGRLVHSGGNVRIGCDDAATAYDNERPPRSIELEPFWIDSAPVTVRAYAAFVESGAYQDARRWSPEGWAWVQKTGARAPVGFSDQHLGAPVTCLSWFEADACARFLGARLPTEEEREASGLPSAGVWEWTASWFGPYPGFRPYPYDGYSLPWFGSTHRVLRGGSWATAPALLRPSFRNWYDPGFRDLPSGFRCAGGLE